MNATTIERLDLYDWSTGGRVDALTIYYPCGDWETYPSDDPSEFSDWSQWHRRVCKACESS